MIRFADSLKECGWSKYKDHDALAAQSVAGATGKVIEIVNESEDKEIVSKEAEGDFFHKPDT
jgi:hypothetical protein